MEFEIKIIFWQPFSLSIGVFANFWPMFLLLNEIKSWRVTKFKTGQVSPSWNQKLPELFWHVRYLFKTLSSGNIKFRDAVRIIYFVLDRTLERIIPRYSKVVLTCTTHEVREWQTCSEQPCSWSVLSSAIRWLSVLERVPQMCTKVHRPGVISKIKLRQKCSLL